MSPDQVSADSLLVDVRTDDEWSAGHVRAALHLPLDQLEQRAATLLPDKGAKIVTYCMAGPRAQRAAEALRTMGYHNVRAITGGYTALKQAGFAVNE